MLVASAALGALGKMITRKENADYILRCGGLEAALRVMIQHPEDETVAKYGLAFLHAMCQHAETRSAVVGQGGIAAAINILSTHMENADVSRHFIPNSWLYLVSDAYLVVVTACGSGSSNPWSM